MTVISVDLAYKQYSDIGVALLDVVEGGIRCAFHSVSLVAEPDANHLAEYLTTLCAKQKADILLIDGPQGWKHPDNGLTHSRVCERALNTPAKTGLPEIVKPANYAPFVRFSVKVFDHLIQRGWTLFSGMADHNGKRTLIESFPLSAWNSLKIPSLPAKSKAKQADIENRLAEIQHRFPLTCAGAPRHDDLQALVSGLAGVAIEMGMENCVTMAGRSPEMLEGRWREGFIVNPASPVDWLSILPNRAL